MKIRNLIFISVILILLSIGFVSADWWDGDWIFRKNINIDGGSETLDDFTVLLKVDYDSDMQSDFEDLRFIDGECSGVQTNELAYEFDKVVNSDYALVWVNIPELNPGTNNICMYYNNPSATNGEDIENSWDDNYVGIWHFKEGSGTTTEDSVGDGDGTFFGTPTWTTGKIGNAVEFDGNDKIDLDTNTGIKLTSAPMTIESWGYATSFPDANLASIITSTTAYGYVFGVDWSPNNLVLAVIGGTARSTNTFPLNIWKKLTVTYSTSNEVNFYQNKVSDSGNPHLYSNSFSATDMAIGGRSSKYDAWWYGKLDEIRVSNIVRSQAWLDRSYDNIDLNLVSFGPEIEKCPDDEICLKSPEEGEELSRTDPANFEWETELDLSQFKVQYSQTSDFRKAKKLGKGVKSGYSYTPSEKDWSKLRKEANKDDDDILYWRVEGKGSAKQYSNIFSFSLEPPVPVELLTPAEGEEVEIGDEFSWNWGSYTRATLQVSTTPDFNKKQTTKLTKIKKDKALSYTLNSKGMKKLDKLSDKYDVDTLYWRLEVQDKEKLKDVSEMRSFKI